MSEGDLVASLESRINMLTRQNSDLQGRLERVEKDKTEYLQNVSHQLVAPLNAIKWHIENLTEGRISYERAVKVLRSIYSQATLAVHLAKNFNLMSNLEADHALSSMREPLQEVELQRLLINLADDFQPLAWDQELKIIVDKKAFPNGPAVLAIKPLTSQVFSNIIENSVKYSHRGSEVIIRGEYLKGSDSFAVTLQNKGISFGKDYQAKMFTRGYRSEEAKRKYPAGTGFGLYIARRIVEIHEGKIEAFAKDGWNIFRVELTVQGLKGKARIRGPKENSVS